MYKLILFAFLNFSKHNFHFCCFSLTTSIGSCTESFCHKHFIGTNFVDSKVVVDSDDLVDPNIKSVFSKSN